MDAGNGEKSDNGQQKVKLGGLPKSNMAMMEPGGIRAKRQSKSRVMAPNNVMSDSARSSGS